MILDTVSLVANLLETKILLNSTISDTNIGVQFIRLDIKPKSNEKKLTISSPKLLLIV